MKTLDCTLRDGGYINNWLFGKQAIKDIIGILSGVGVDYLELGFLRNDTYEPDRAVYAGIRQAAALIPDKTSGQPTYAVMADFADLIALDKIEPFQKGFPKMIRVLIWKQKRDRNGVLHDALWEGYDYCQGLIEKGYQVSVQLTRTNQYSSEEFLHAMRMFSQLNISAVYVADSWGNMTVREVIDYLRIADDVLRKGVLLGYHGHDNQGRAEEIARRVMETPFNHEIIIDGSVDGIGKGGGNLKLQYLCQLVAEKYGRRFDIGAIERISEQYIQSIYRQHAWGGEAFAITGRYNCNPYYADYYMNERHLGVSEIETIISALSEEDRIMFNRQKAYVRMQQILYHKNIDIQTVIPKKTVITYGTFDLLHQGHINLLRRARALGDYLIVGVTSPEFDKERGKANVRQSLEERIQNVRSTGFANEIVVERNKWQKVHDIMRYNVDIFTVGSDWVGKFDYLNKYCQVVYLPRTEGISSTMLRSNLT